MKPEEKITLTNEELAKVIVTHITGALSGAGHPVGYKVVRKLKGVYMGEGATPKGIKDALGLYEMYADPKFNQR